MARIVLIDDEPVLRMTFRHFLEANGHAVRDAENGKVGVRLCREEPPDLVITDMMMPEQPGAETLEILSREYPGMPIVAMSGAAPGPVQAQGSQICFVTKPIDRPMLLNIVNSMLAQSQGDRSV